MSSEREGAMQLDVSPYLEQKAAWPDTGRHILAQHDEDTVFVYQAYRPAIGHFAAEYGVFGGPFKYTRMSWIKPNFLWMMYRSGWGTKEGQEVTLAVRLRRSFFDEILAAAVPSSYSSRVSKNQVFESREQWQKAVQGSDVRLQWDPDHSPTGHKVERRAIQLGLRGSMLERYGKTESLEILDISDFVAEQREHATPPRYDRLLTPTESVYRPADPDVARRLGLS